MSEKLPSTNPGSFGKALVLQDRAITPAGQSYRSLQRLLLLLLFGVYVSITFIGSSAEFHGDEGGYVESALRVLHRPPLSPYELRSHGGPGYPNLRFWWGPGYPLMLVPFITAGAPWIAPKFLNAFLLIGAVAYFRALMGKYVAETAGLLITLCLGLYPPFLRTLAGLGPENLVTFLICGFMFHVCSLYTGEKHTKLHLAAASVYVAYLALTKIFFGYVIATLLFFLLIPAIWRRSRRLVTAASVFLLALIWCVPYLWYTYAVTGKLFYWGSSGGMSFYWMSSPEAKELGSWFSVDDVKQRPELASHRDFFATLEGLSEVQRDDAFRKKAIENVAHHPGKFLVNWTANAGRLLFSYPFSFGVHSLSTYYYLLPNMFVIVLLVLSAFPVLLRPQAVRFELWLMSAFAAVSIAGSTVVSAYDRQFRPIVPVLCAWLAFVYLRVMRIELRGVESVPAKLDASVAPSVSRLTSSRSKTCDAVFT